MSEEKKMCHKCGQEKLLSKFHKDKYSKDGFQHKCKICFKRYVLKHKEELKQYSKQYNKKYNSEHKDERKLYDKQYKYKHKDDIKIYNKQYHKQYEIGHKNNKYENNSLVNCRQCNKAFFKLNWDIKRHKNNFCSYSCSSIY